MNIVLASPLQKDSIVDGEGIRTVIWTQGCSHNCLGCHNMETHDFNGGKKFNVEEIKIQISNLKDQDGITFSGGDPMFQAKACGILAKHAKEMGFNIWCYTGFTFEQLLEMSKTKKEILEFLSYIDVLIDGKFVLAERSLELKYRGSKNQRIIDVNLSLENKKAITIPKYMENKSSFMTNKEQKIIDGIFI